MIITKWGDDYACSVSSPQLPGIVAAYDEVPNTSELHSLAVAAGLQAVGSIDVHFEHAVDIDDRPFFVRIRHDFNASERTKIAMQIEAAIRSDEGIRAYGEADRIGDTLFVAALMSDRVRDVMATAIKDQPITVGAPNDEGGIDFIGLSDSSDESGRRRLDDLGLDESSRISEIMAIIDGSDGRVLNQHEHLLVSA